MWSAGPGDDQARFLADLRALRGTAAIGVDELAARAHYPSGILKEAENGPLLPGLPILTAYVRACDGDVPDWEERWRHLTSEIPEDPELPVRAPGASPAAVAGARAGVGIAPPDVYDPERIRAALRGGHGHPDQGGQGASRGSSARAKAATGWSSTPSWEAASDQSIAANGNHATTSWSREPFDTAAKPDPPEGFDHYDQFHWLPENESAAPADDTGQADAWQVDAGQADTGQADTWQVDAGQVDAGQADTWQVDAGQVDAGQVDAGQVDAGQVDAGQAGNGRADAWQAAAGQAGTGRTDAWQTDAGTSRAWPAAETEVEPVTRDWAPQDQDDVLKPPERTDFWTTAVATPAADLQQPLGPPHGAEDQTYTQTSWSAAARTGADTSAPEAAAASARPQFGAESAPSARPATATQPRTPAESFASARSAASTGAPVGQPAGHEAANQKDRFFPARLLIIIVIAALIGSALVLLLK